MKTLFYKTFIILFFLSSCGVIEHIKEAQKKPVTSGEKNITELPNDSSKKSKNQKKSKDQKEPKEQAVSKSPKQTKTNKSNYSYFEKKWKISLLGKENLKLLKEIDGWLGTPYRYGGTTKSGVDCSGMTIAIYKQVYDINLSRSSYNIWKESKSISQKNLIDGDLVFFKIDYKNISHVGIYISKGNFVHASTSKGVIISNLEEDYYKKRFHTGGRVKH